MIEIKKLEKVVILGGGCAGWTAAVYASRADLEPLVIEGPEPGGQLSLTTTVENYPGFPEGVLGPELIEKFKKQAIKFGARVLREKATSFKVIKEHFELGVNKKKIKAKCVIIATGASARVLGLESEKKYFGRGISTCVTCDAYFYKDADEVVVIGGGDSACEEALTLAKFAKHVSIVYRRDELRASKIMQKRVFGNKKIDVVWNTIVQEFFGTDDKITGIKLKNVKTGEIKEHSCAGAFLAIGHVPNTKIFKEIIELDKKGFIKTDHRTRTNVRGVFACGDVQDPVYKQVITAAGTGCIAAIEAEKYLES